MWELRAHHLMCILGYKGYNYSGKTKNQWGAFLADAKKDSFLKIKIVNGYDSLCAKCPATEQVSRCKDKVVNKIDKKVMKLLHIKNGQEFFFLDLIEKLQNVMTPQKHQKICGECSWRTLGLCKDTFQKTK